VTGYSDRKSLRRPLVSNLLSPVSISCRGERSGSILLAISLLLALYAQMMGSVRCKSATYDEQEYVARGYAVLRTGDMRLRLRHPLLTNLISAVPLLLLPDLRVPTDHDSWADAEFHEFSAQFLWVYNRERADQIVYLSRWPMMLLTLVLAAFVYRWARALHGAAGSLLALALVAFDPNLIAHGRLANTDVGATIFIFVAAYAFWEYQRRPGWRRLLLAGIACGLAQATRFTAMLLFPILGLEALTAVWQTTRPEPVEAKNSLRRRQTGRAVLEILALAVISLGVVWAVYGFTWGPVEETGLLLPLPAPDHWGELHSLIRRLGRTDRAFLLGRIYEGGQWPYFFVAFAVKTPLPTLLLIGWATVRLIKRNSISWHGCLRRDVPVLLPAVAYFAAAVVGNLNTGYRLILPILPFLVVHTARLAPSRPFYYKGKRSGSFDKLRANFVPDASRPLPLASHLSRYILLVSMAALVLSTLSIYPHYLAYFNELVGPRNGYKVLVDSNLDWGQDLPGLRSWMSEHDVQQVYLSWFGIAPPEHYGVRYRYLPGWPPFENPALRVYHPERPLPGIYAISATNLQGVLLDEPDTFAFFQAQRPVAQVGYSILIYEVPASAPPADLALGGVRLDQVPAPLLDAHLATNDLRLRWFDPASSLILMSHRPRAYYAIADDTPLVEPLAARFTADLEPLAEGPGFHLYPAPDAAKVSERLAIAATSPVLRSPEVEFAPGDASDVRQPVSLPVSFDGQVAFLGYEFLTPPSDPGADVALLTYWRVLERPAQPLKIFVHLLDDHSVIWGQHDGLDVPVEGWHPGDVFVQLHTFSVSTHAPSGRYWIEIGLYRTRDMERLRAFDHDGVPVGKRLLLQQMRLATGGG
jgi:hypothetical protein